MNTMNVEATLPGVRSDAGVASPLLRPTKKAPLSFRLSHQARADDPAQRHAEFFYLQKQIQSQTPMVIVLADGQHIEGCIEWYDLKAIKVRGRDKVLVYKSAIKYMYKLGENAQ